MTTNPINPKKKKIREIPTPKARLSSKSITSCKSEQSDHDKYDNLHVDVSEPKEQEIKTEEIQKILPPQVEVNAGTSNKPSRRSSQISHASQQQKQQNQKQKQLDSSSNSTKNSARRRPQSAHVRSPTHTRHARSTHQLYKECLELSKEKDDKHQQTLRLQSRLATLKRELARVYRQKMREDRKKEQLEMIHREQIETRRLLNKLKRQREKEIAKNRIKFAKLKKANKDSLKMRKASNLEYKQQLAQNTRYQSKIREKVAKKNAQKDFHKKKRMRKEIMRSERNMSFSKGAHLEQMLKQLEMEYDTRAKREEAEIQKEETKIKELRERCDVVQAMLSELRETGKMPDNDPTDTMSVSIHI